MGIARQPAPASLVVTARIENDAFFEAAKWIRYWEPSREQESGAGR
jgi:hypothetical protein